MCYDNSKSNNLHMTHYAIIGDIHSQGKLLSEALAYCKERNLTPLMLGDLFDSRCDVSETIYVYNLARAAQKEQNAIILNSNHGERLVQALCGEIEEASYCEETFRSLREFQEAGIDEEELAIWLSMMPEGFVFFDSKGHEYCCAHAFFPTKYRKRGETQNYFVRSATDEDTQLFTWGPMNRHYRRIQWWNKDTERDGFTRVAGHYHLIHQSPGSLVLDANAGFDFGAAVLYDVEEGKMVYFGLQDYIINQDNLEVA